MQIKLVKLILVCLLLCSLFLTSYITVFNTNGIVSTDVNTSDRMSKHSSMSGSVGHVDYMTATNIFVKTAVFTMKLSRWLGVKTSFNILTAIFAAQMTCLNYYSRFSDKTYTQLISRIIVVYLHNKDGIK